MASMQLGVSTKRCDSLFTAMSKSDDPQKRMISQLTDCNASILSSSSAAFCTAMALSSKKSAFSVNLILVIGSVCLCLAKRRRR